MAETLSDQEIADLLAERKPLPEDYQSRLRPRSKRGHKERDLTVSGSQGRQFRLLLRQSEANPLDFSVVLLYCPAGSSREFRLRRYNGKSHEHSNPIEGDKFYDFHTHEATERYQLRGDREDAFARRSDCFASLEEAVKCALDDCSFSPPSRPDGRLFQEAN
jgi:hypothetical protein